MVFALHSCSGFGVRACAPGHPISASKPPAAAVTIHRPIR
jgi:hypothetical protein